MADSALKITTYRDAVCTACGCLCDDIDLSVSDNRIVAADRACFLGTSWFLADHSRQDRSVAMVNGIHTSAEAAIAEAVTILRASRSPIVLGLTQTTIETQKEAVAIADRIGATIDPGRSADSLARWRAIQRVGMVSATLGEVRNRADVIVFWGVDPVSTHPRHLERYSGDPVGRFVPKGRRGRTIVVVDAEASTTSKVADHFLRISQADQADALSMLRMLVRAVEPREVPPALRQLAETMRSARYGAIFFGPNLGESANVEEALKLVRDLNRFTRFVALTLGGPGNPGGAEAVLSWQAGSPRAVNFGAGYPRFLPGDASSERLARGEADVALVVADDPGSFLTPDALAQFDRIPTIVISPNATAGRFTVAMNSAIPGIHATGTVLRCDGAALPLQAPVKSDLPSDRDWLIAIRKKLVEASS